MAIFQTCTNRLNRRIFLFLCLVIFALAGPFGCGDDDDNDDDDTADDDDDDNDDDQNPIDITIAPYGDAMPAGDQAVFSATAIYADNTEIVNPEGLSWATSDDSVATVIDGTVTAVANGNATLTASMGDETKASVTGSVPIMVGPDVFIFDLMGGFGALDRASDTYIPDYLDSEGDKGPTFGAAVTTVPNYMLFYMGEAFVVDSGTGDAGTGKVARVDVMEKSTEDISLSINTPYGAAIYDDTLWVTGNLGDELAQVNLETQAEQVITLPDGCGPGYVAGANGKIYVGCTGFVSWGVYNPGKVAVYDPATQAVTEIALDTVNPGFVVPNEDESAVYVIATGDFADVTGKIFRIDTTTDTVANSFALGLSPSVASLSPQGKLFIADGSMATALPAIYVVDTTADDAILRGTDDPITTGNPGAWLASVLAHPDVDEVYVTHLDFYALANTIEVFSAMDYSPLHSYDAAAVGGMPQGLTAW